MTFSLYNRFRDLEKVRVDSSAIEGFLGAAGTDGVLRTSAPLSYIDGGDYITLGITQSDTDTNGYLSSTDWDTFNAKAAASHAMSTHSDEDTYNISTSGTAEVASIVVDGTAAKGLEFTGASSSGHIVVNGNALLSSGEQSIYINLTAETAAVNGIWTTLKSTVTSGDLTGVRLRVYGNAASAGASVRGAYVEAIGEASKYAAMLEGSLSHASYAAGSVTVSGDIRGSTSHISQGSGLNAANLYGHLITVQTRGDETITTNDYGMRINNEAVGGNGRQMDGGIQIVNTNMGGGTNGFGYGIDMSGADIATADIIFSDSTATTGVATAAEINTGTAAARIVSADSLAGSYAGTKVVVVKVIDDGTALTTGDAKTHWTVPIELNGMDLVTVGAHVYTASSSGLPSFQLHNLTDTSDILSTNLTIDANEIDSKDATTAAVINTSEDDFVTGDVIRFDCDAAGTGCKGMEIRLGFRLP